MNLLAAILATTILAGCAREPQGPKPVASPSAGDELFLEGFFPIGVFSQPADSFAKWKSRGINTVLEVPMRHDAAAWDKAARSAGLKVIRRPAADPKSDIGRKDLLAWSHWDEPDAAGRIIEWTPLFEKTYAEWKRIDPNRKVFINFAGPDLSWFTQRSDSYSKNYASYYPRLIASADWIANDLYPCGGWLNDAHKARRGDVTLIAEPLKILRQMTPKPLFAFIELSEIEAGNVAGARCPTPAEVRAEIWLAIIHGARGLFYFPAVVGKNGFQFDGAPGPVVEEMTRQNAMIQKLAPALQGPVDPPALQPKVPAPLQAGWRKTSTGWLLIVVNPTPRNLTEVTIGLNSPMDVREVGFETIVRGKPTITRPFDPFSVRLFELNDR